jgi:hypothetical protein
MIHDLDLVDRLSVLPFEPFAGEVFRTTRVSADPIAPSTSGGRAGHQAPAMGSKYLSFTPALNATRPSRR